MRSQETRPTIRARVMANLKRVSPSLIWRIAGVTLFFAPTLLISFVRSWRRHLHWRRPEAAREFVRSRRVFRDLIPDFLESKLLAGGVSNANQVWTCRRKNGRVAKYFAKVFLPVGDCWAKHLSKVSPFPQVKAGTPRERLLAEAGALSYLAERDIAVPRVVAYDEKEGILVAEYLEGENVDSILRQAAARGRFTDEDLEVIIRAGQELGKIHMAGFSVIDTQPTNCLWVPSKSRVYFTDFEFGTRSRDHRLWDAGFFLCFLTLRLPEAMKEAAASLFISAYGGECPVEPREIVGESHRLDAYQPILETILDLRQFTPDELAAEIAR